MDRDFPYKDKAAKKILQTTVAEKLKGLLEKILEYNIKDRNGVYFTGIKQKREIPRNTMSRLNRHHFKMHKY